ncbi:hypothetical protein ES708_34262 [subsurface metagenome]
MPILGQFLRPDEEGLILILFHILCLLPLIFSLDDRHNPGDSGIGYYFGLISELSYNFL